MADEGDLTSDQTEKVLHFQVSRHLFVIYLICVHNVMWLLRFMRACGLLKSVMQTGVVNRCD